MYVHPCVCGWDMHACACTMILTYVRTWKFSGFMSSTSHPDLEAPTCKISARIIVGFLAYFLGPLLHFYERWNTLEGPGNRQTDGHTLLHLAGRSKMVHLSIKEVACVFKHTQWSFCTWSNFLHTKGSSRMEWHTQVQTDTHTLSIQVVAHYAERGCG